MDFFWIFFGFFLDFLKFFFHFVPSLNTQSSIRGLLGVQDFCFWAVCAAGPVMKKEGPIMSNFEGSFFMFLGSKKNFFFENTIASALKNIFSFFYFFLFFFGIKQFFRALHILKYRCTM